MSDFYHCLTGSGLDFVHKYNVAEQMLEIIICELVVYAGNGAWMGLCSWLGWHGWHAARNYTVSMLSLCYVS